MFVNTKKIKKRKEFNILAQNSTIMNTQTRHCAQKVWIAEILNGKFIQGDDQTPAHVFSNNKNLLRVNILGAIVAKTKEGQNNEIQTIELEDGTAKISARTFDSKEIKAEIGDCVFLIGKIRAYNNQIYIAAEIIKKIEQIEWIQLRKKELPAPKEEQKPEVTQELPKQEQENTAAKILELIRKKDPGNGADYDEIIQQSKIVDAEKIIQTLIQKGEIFHVAPSKIKVLE